MKKVVFLSLFLFVSLQAADGSASLAPDRYAVLQNVLITHGPRNLEEILRINNQIMAQLQNVIDNYSFTDKRLRYLNKLHYDVYHKAKAHPKTPLLQLILARAEFRKPENAQLGHTIDVLQNHMPYLRNIIIRIQSFLSRLNWFAQTIISLNGRSENLEGEEILNAYYSVLQNIRSDIVWYQQRFGPLDITLD